MLHTVLIAVSAMRDQSAEWEDGCVDLVDDNGFDAPMDGSQAGGPSRDHGMKPGLDLVSGSKTIGGTVPAQLLRPPFH